MRVRELMSSPARTCGPQDTLAQAARLMWENDCGILPVVDGNGRVGGAITDRDICMGAYTKGLHLAELRVSDSMSGSVITVGAEDDLAAAAKLMADNQIRRLPVVDAEGRIAGVLSLNDFARAAPKDTKVGKDALKALTAICQPRAAASAVGEPPAKAGAKTRARSGKANTKRKGGKEAES